MYEDIEKKMVLYRTFEPLYQNVHGRLQYVSTSLSFLDREYSDNWRYTIPYFANEQIQIRLSNVFDSS